MPALKLIYARAANGVIGKDNRLPWHLPEDLAHFKRLTTGHPVLMGRKTWDSLPPRFRPLPGRRNLVLTRDAAWRAEGAHAVGSIEAALALSADAAELWVIGGAEVYRQALPYAQAVVVTEIAQDFEGDAYAPTLGPEWRETSREAHTAANGLGYAFVGHQRQD